MEAIRYLLQGLLSASAGTLLSLPRMKSGSCQSATRMSSWADYVRQAWAGRYAVVLTPATALSSLTVLPDTPSAPTSTPVSSTIIACQAFVLDRMRLETIPPLHLLVGLHERGQIIEVFRELKGGTTICAVIVCKMAFAILDRYQSHRQDFSVRLSKVAGANVVWVRLPSGRTAIYQHSWRVAAGLGQIFGRNAQCLLSEERTRPAVRVTDAGSFGAGE